MFRNIINTWRNTCCRALIVKKTSFQHNTIISKKKFKRQLKSIESPQPSHEIVYEFDKSKLFSVTNSTVNTENMDDSNEGSLLKLPVKIKGMTVLDRSMFQDEIQVQAIAIKTPKLKGVLKTLKKFQIKLKKIKPVLDIEKTDPRHSTHRLLLLDPNLVAQWHDLPASVQDRLKHDDVCAEDLREFSLKLGYENWTFSEIMTAILPDGVSGFAQVGHIAHFNLREKSLPYKSIIGEVLLDKISTVKTVVNKLNTIDNTYRTFQMELMAGEDNYVTQTRENGCTYELDFSKVYWNSKLGHEHEYIVEHIKSTDIVFDIFAGIGPFAVPAAKKRAIVFANDLNPHSYVSLVKNIKLNKCGKNINCFNLDGREFIQTCVKDELSKLYCTSDKGDNNGVLLQSREVTNVAILMNLPALAVTFLDAFRSLLSSIDDLKTSNTGLPLPTVHCYCFTNNEEAVSAHDGDMKAEIKHRVIKVVGPDVLTKGDIDVRWVRSVAPLKDMMCVSFRLTRDILLGQRSNSRLDSHDDEPLCKRAKCEDSAGAEQQTEQQDMAA